MSVSKTANRNKNKKPELIDMRLLKHAHLPLDLIKMEENGYYKQPSKKELESLNKMNQKQPTLKPPAPAAQKQPPPAPAPAQKQPPPAPTLKPALKAPALKAPPQEKTSSVTVKEKTKTFEIKNAQNEYDILKENNIELKNLPNKTKNPDKHIINFLHKVFNLVNDKKITQLMLDNIILPELNDYILDVGNINEKPYSIEINKKKIIVNFSNNNKDKKTGKEIDKKIFKIKKDNEDQEHDFTVTNIKTIIFNNKNGGKRVNNTYKRISKKYKKTHRKKKGYYHTKRKKQKYINKTKKHKKRLK